jgi:uncharacterized LabA/DUF88 family protein
MPEAPPANKRAGFYVDGYNVYHAISKLGENHLKWMCYRAAANQLAPRGEEVTIVKVFTAYPYYLRHSKDNYAAYVKALKAREVEVYEGTFKQKVEDCRNCGHTWPDHEEKESDVNLALHLLNDAKDGRVDVAYLLTCDSDLAPAVRLVRQFAPTIELVHVTPPGMSFCTSINNHCQRNAKLTKGIVQTSLLPERVLDKQGNVAATRPAIYKPPRDA